MSTNNAMCGRSCGFCKSRWTLCQTKDEYRPWLKDDPTETNFFKWLISDEKLQNSRIINLDGWPDTNAGPTYVLKRGQDVISHKAMIAMATPLCCQRKYQTKCLSLTFSWRNKNNFFPTRLFTSYSRRWGFFLFNNLKFIIYIFVFILKCPFA